MEKVISTKNKLKKIAVYLLSILIFNLLTYSVTEEPGGGSLLPANEKKSPTQKTKAREFSLPKLGLISLPPFVLLGFLVSCFKKRSSYVGSLPEDAAVSSEDIKNLLGFINETLLKTKSRGIKNAGLSCYINACIQILLQDEGVRKEISKYNGNLESLKTLRNVFLNILSEKTECYQLNDRELKNFGYKNKEDDVREIAQFFLGCLFEDLEAHCGLITSISFDGDSDLFSMLEKTIFNTEIEGFQKKSEELIEDKKLESFEREAAINFLSNLFHNSQEEKFTFDCNSENRVKLDEALASFEVVKRACCGFPDSVLNEIIEVNKKKIEDDIKIVSSALENKLFPREYTANTYEVESSNNMGLLYDYAFEIGILDSESRGAAQRTERIKNLKKAGKIKYCEDLGIDIRKKSKEELEIIEQIIYRFWPPQDWFEIDEEGLPIKDRAKLLLFKLYSSNYSLNFVKKPFPSIEAFCFALDKGILPEKLKKSKEYCEIVTLKKGGPQKYSKTINLSSCNSFLLGLERFLEISRGNFSFNKTKIKIPPIIYLKEVGYKIDSSVTDGYVLISVVICIPGKVGHFITFSKRQDGWWCFNDEEVSKVRWEDVKKIAETNGVLFLYQGRP
ncbi:MAG: ubiquitin carboxyl-terminal hydrolase [Oscillospiraceae bacterium]|jgi:hypothetical protein|nr:ubiquitin carboxyl-terminal hydrolase [Oscillospiraceae bacterium]